MPCKYDIETPEYMVDLKDKMCIYKVYVDEANLQRAGELLDERGMNIWARKQTCPTHDDNQEKKKMKPADLPFERALELIKEGFRLSRKGWNGKRQCIFLMDGYPEGVPANPALAKRSGIKEGRTVIVDPYIMMKNTRGHIVPWIASQGDLLANDWEIITIGKIIGVDFVGTAAVVVEANIEDDIAYIKKVKWMEVE